MSATSWSKINLWLNWAVQILDYDPLADTHHTVENTQKEIVDLKTRINELENPKLKA